jgi:hypothetical protein
LERLEMVEDALVERVHAMAAVHPEDVIQQLGVELVPRQARRRGDIAP